MAELIEISRPAEGVLQFTLNRPQKLNALSIALVRELAAVLEAAEADEKVRCVVLTGRGRAFSAGADIADQHAYGEDVPFNVSRLRDWTSIQNFAKPMVAAVSGYCLGGGNELAMLADIIIACDDARFGQPEIKIGIYPGDGGTQRLVRAVGKSMAMQMILSGQAIEAMTALRAGLVSEVLAPDQFLDRAVAVAGTIACHSPIALMAAKRAVLQSFETSLSAGLAYEREGLRLPFASEDRREGMAAFLERREPSFKGR